MSRSSLAKREAPLPDLDGLLCALVLAPGSYSRNRFYSFFTDARAARVRRRASRLAGIVRHLASHAEPRAVLLDDERVGEDDTRWLLRYRMPIVGVERTAILDSLEEATVRYALHRAGAPSFEILSERHRDEVESALRKLGEGIALDRDDD